MNNSVEDAPADRSQGSLLHVTFRLIVASRWLLTGCVLLGLVLNVVALRGGAPAYKVEALLIENSEPVNGMRSGGGGASALSLVLGGGSALPEIDEFQDLLGSPEVATVIENKYHITHEVFSSLWDDKTGTWKQPGLRERFHLWIVEVLGGVKLHNPDNYELARFLTSSVKFDRAQMGSVMSISMISDRPELAEKWLKIIIAEVSDVIRAQMIQERQSYVDYLQQQLGQSSLTSSRDAIISILADQYRSLMVLQSAKTFPLQQIQPPTRGDYPVNKSVSLAVLTGVLSGLFLAGVLMACGLSDASLSRLYSRLRK